MDVMLRTKLLNLYTSILAKLVFAYLQPLSIGPFLYIVNNILLESILSNLNLKFKTLSLLLILFVLENKGEICSKKIM